MQLHELEHDVRGVCEFLSGVLSATSEYRSACGVVEVFLFYAREINSPTARGGFHTDQSCSRLLAFGDALFKEVPIVEGIQGPNMYMPSTQFGSGRIQQRRGSLLGQMLKQALVFFKESGPREEEARETCQFLLSRQLPQFAECWKELRQILEPMGSLAVDKPASARRISLAKTFSDRGEVCL
jgi:hypothetical protein